MRSFRVLQIDHVELFVPDRHEAARWYQRILGLDVVPGYEDWAADPGGPLMISSDDGSTKLALFEGRSQQSPSTEGFHLVAFRVSANGFIEFVRRVGDLQLKDSRARPVTSDSVIDHQKAYSIYFCDPYGHRLELTTYEYEATGAGLADVRQHTR